MSQYQIGSVNVTNGSAVVTGNGTIWLASLTVGDLFKVRDINVIYEIGSIESDTQITLTSVWAGATLVYQSYVVIVDFTTNYLFPEISTGDKDWSFFVTKAIRMIDEQIKVMMDRIETKATTTTTTTTTSSSTSSSSSSSSSTISTTSSTTTTTGP